MLKKIINVIFWSRYYRLAAEQQDRYKNLLMGGGIGKDWALHYDSTIFPPEPDTVMIGKVDWYQAMPIIEPIKKVLSNEQKVTTVQVGASSGRELHYFANLYPNQQFIYTDAFESVTLQSEKKYARANISFKTRSFSNLKDIFAVESKYLIFSSGSLQYARGEEINVLLTDLRDTGKSVDLIIIEPVQLSKLSSGKDLHYPRGNFSYTHDYSKLCEIIGFETLESKIIRCYEPNDPVHYDTGHHFYWGRIHSIKSAQTAN